MKLGNFPITFPKNSHDAQIATGAILALPENTIIGVSRYYPPHVSCSDGNRLEVTIRNVLNGGIIDINVPEESKFVKASEERVEFEYRGVLYRVIF